MHRTEGTNNSNNLFTSGPPGTNVEENWLNSIQEEICNVIEEAGLTLKTAGNDTRDQLKAAIDLIAPVAVFQSGTKMYFYQDLAPSGWTIDGVCADAILAVKGGANAYNTVGGSQAGTWTQPNHTHGVGTYAVGAHTHGVGTFAGPSHTHGVGSYAGPSHTHGVGTFAGPDHTHNSGTYEAEDHLHSAGNLNGPSHTHGAGTLAFANHSHVLANGSGIPNMNASFTHDVACANDDSDEYLKAHDGTSGAATIYYQKNYTDSDGTGAVSGSTASDGTGSVTGNTNLAGVLDVSGNSGSGGTGAITGTSAADGTGAITGTSASETPTFAGSSAAGATANTWRPLAQVGIIATKN